MNIWLVNTRNEPKTYFVVGRDGFVIHEKNDLPPSEVESEDIAAALLHFLEEGYGVEEVGYCAAEHRETVSERGRFRRPEQPSPDDYRRDDSVQGYQSAGKNGHLLFDKVLRFNLTAFGCWVRG